MLCFWHIEVFLKEGQWCRLHFYTFKYHLSFYYEWEWWRPTPMTWTRSRFWFSLTGERLRTKEMKAMRMRRWTRIPQEWMSQRCRMEVEDGEDEDEAVEEYHTARIRAEWKTHKLEMSKREGIFWVASQHWFQNSFRNQDRTITAKLGKHVLQKAKAD